MASAFAHLKLQKVEVRERRSDEDVVIQAVNDHVDGLIVNGENLNPDMKVVLKSILTKALIAMLHSRTTGNKETGKKYRTEFANTIGKEDRKFIYGIFNIESKAQWSSFIDSMNTLFEGIPDIAAQFGTSGNGKVQSTSEARR